jgi:hypothetical protein
MINKFSLICFIGIYGSAVFIVQWITGIRIFASSEVVRLQPLMAQTGTDQYSFIKLFCDYGMSGGILVGAYFFGKYLVDRIGDRLEQKINESTTTITTAVDKVQKEVEKWNQQ